MSPGLIYPGRTHFWKWCIAGTSNPPSIQCFLFKSIFVYLYLGTNWQCTISTVLSLPINILYLKIFQAQRLHVLFTIYKFTKFTVTLLFFPCGSSYFYDVKVSKLHINLPSLFMPCQAEYFARGEGSIWTFLCKIFCFLFFYILTLLAIVEMV